MASPRRIRNFLLQPLLQVKIGLYSIVLALAFAITVYLIFRFQFGSFYETILDLTDVREQVTTILGEYMAKTALWLSIAGAVFVAATILLAVVYTHRLVGPSVAFSRHLDALLDDDTRHRTTLRQKDAFKDIADKLNALSEKLSRKS